jgi:adenylosuccinate lyase
MPYKRNPMRSERICALARHLCTLELNASWTASVQWFERTLDDSANRRITLPEGYLAAEAVLILARNVGSGLVVHPAIVARRLDRALPFLVTEEILIAGVRRGGDRQDLHERVRQHALAARERLDDGSDDNDFFQRIADDESFGVTTAELSELAEPDQLVGRCPRQVERFLTERVDPLFEGAEGPPPAEEVRV